MNIKNQKIINDLTKIFIYTSALAFFLLYLMLSFFNRATYDDFSLIYFAKDTNIWNYTIQLSQTWGGRWISWAYFYSIISLSSNFQNIHYAFFIYHLITISILIYSLKKIIEYGIINLFNYSMKPIESFIYSILFIACFYYFTFQSIEAWWYLCGSFHYLQGIVFLLLGTVCILNNKKAVIHYILIVISFVFAGACYEIYPMIIFSILAIVCLYFFLNGKLKDIILKQTLHNKGICIAFLSFFISFLICFFSKGNFERRGYFKENFASFYHPIYWGAIPRIFADKKYGIAICTAFCWFLLGIKIKEHHNSIYSALKIKNILKITFVSLFISIFLLYIFSLLFTYGIQPPARAWTFTSFVLSFLFCFLALVLGIKFSNKQYFSYYVFKTIIPFILMVVFLFNLYNQYKYTSNYAKEYDNLIDSFIEAKKANAKVFYMEKLPESGMLMQLNMQDQTSNPDFLKSTLGLNFRIELKE